MKISMLMRAVVPALLTAAPLFAQTGDRSPFRPLQLATPNGYRSGSGRPGPLYWQQRVDYQIDATLDAARNEVRARENISYHNNSPDTLHYLWLHVEQNICAPGSVTNRLNQPPLVFQNTAFDFSCKGFAGGDSLQFVTSGGHALPTAVFGTTMRIDLPGAIAPGATIALELGWSFRVPEYGAGRMGHDGPLYELAQWYPRVAVYDDVRGWNHEPYIGAGEFYLEYGSFDVTLHVPSNFVVAATGKLLNSEDVLSAAQRERLARALNSEQPVAIITAEEVAGNSLHPASEMRVWRFHADSVRDFAFAAAPNLRWDASGYNGVLINTLYRASAPLWAAEANKIARATIKYFSEQWYPYPYPHATTIEGPIEGMEYPMLTFVPKGADRYDLEWVLMHEFGHEWFPMIVGSNERLYPWMDEGFNTFIDTGAAESYFAGTAYGDTVGAIPLHLYAEHAILGKEQPLITRPIDVHDLFWVAYRKPQLMLNLLRSEVLGPDRFDAAFREYIRAWAFKHPTPADFFRMMRDQSGTDLDWFWRNWVFTTARLDQAIDSITRTKVVLSNQGTMVMPVELKLTYAGGQTEIVKLPVDMWNLGPRFEYRVAAGKRVVRAELDPRRVLPDVNRANNTAVRKSSE